MWNFQYKSEYEACVADLERSGAVQSMRFLPQHAEGVSTYDHASLVAYTSFRVCSLLGLDARAAARGGLLHVLFPVSYTHLDVYKRQGFFVLKHLRTSCKNGMGPC